MIQHAQSPLVAFFVACAFAGVHLVGRRLRYLDGTPRSIWLSIAGGVAVAYVFLHVLPDIAIEMEEAGFEGERSLYMIALAGLCAVYAAESLVKRHERTAQGAEGAGAFWVHIGSYALYNALIGYLLVHREVETALSLFAYALAMGVHFMANDWGLRQTHPALYHRFGRWVLAVAVMAGWGVGSAMAVSEQVVASLFAFLAGGVIMNVLKEELPEERESRLWAFMLGIVSFSGLLLLVE